MLASNILIDFLKMFYNNLTSQTGVLHQSEDEKLIIVHAGRNEFLTTKANQNDADPTLKPYRKPCGKATRMWNSLESRSSRHKWGQTADKIDKMSTG
jgi:transposase